MVNYYTAAQLVCIMHFEFNIVTVTESPPVFNTFLRKLMFQFNREVQFLHNIVESRVSERSAVKNSKEEDRNEDRNEDRKTLCTTCFIFNITPN